MVKTTGDVRLPDESVVSRGAKVVGHVTQAKALSGGDAESSLGIAFDKIELKDGKTVTIAGIIRALAPPTDAKPGFQDEAAGVGYGDMKQTITNSQGGTKWAPVPALYEQSEGVQGIKDLQLKSDGVITSDGKTVKLDNGSQILVRAQLAGGN